MANSKGFSLRYSFKGALHQAHFAEQQPLLQDLALNLQQATGMAFHSLKLLGPGITGSLMLSQNRDQTVFEAGLLPSKQYMLLGSPQDEIDAVNEGKTLPGIIGFEAEARRLAMRRRTDSNHNPKPPGGEFTFKDFKVLDLAWASPPPSEALKILYQLASDPGILGIMKERRWKVGLLSEMPPEGKVGISQMCVLGYNVNKGQEISLRLRTDDMKGFRKYRAVRNTLLHELAHMIWSEHDNNFKALNSELCQRCDRINVEESSGIILGQSPMGFQPLEDHEGEFDEMAKERLDGRAVGGVRLEFTPGAAAARAATKRMSAVDTIESMMDRKTTGSISNAEIIYHEVRRASTCQPSQSSNGTESSGIGLPKKRDTNMSESRPSLGEGESHGTPLGRSNHAKPTHASNVASSSRGSEHENVDHPENTVHEIGGISAVASGPKEMDSGRPAQQFPEEDPIHIELGLASDDPALDRISRARSAVYGLASLPRHNAQDALLTIEKILKNALTHQGVDKFRSIRLNNSAFSQKVGCYPDALNLIKLFGFVEEGYPVNPILNLKREDPGLLWLGLSVVKEGLEKIGCES